MSDAPADPPPPANPAGELPGPSVIQLLRQVIPQALLWYAVSSAVVVLTVLYCTWAPKPDQPSWYSRFNCWDGVAYTALCLGDYPEEEERTHRGYLPGYPLTARPLTWIGLPAEVALLDANGALYLTAGLESHQPARDLLMAKMNEQATLTGTLVKKGGVQMLYVESAK